MHGARTNEADQIGKVVLLITIGDLLVDGGIETILTRWLIAECDGGFKSIFLVRNRRWPRRRWILAGAVSFKAIWNRD